MKKLEIGPGDCPLGDDWDKMDAVVPKNSNWFSARWGYEPLCLPDNHYDLIFSSHTIEHIPWYQTIDALKDVHRILKPKGVFECWTVDFAAVVQAYLRKEWAGDWDCGGRVKHFMHSIAGRTFAYEKHDNSFMWHKALFDFEYLTECMYQSGFSICGRLDKSQNRGHDHGVINLGVWAKK